MTGPELYAKHLAEADDGTPLALAMQRVLYGGASVTDMIAFIKWELWSCIMCLPPMSAPKGELLDNGNEPTTVTDPWHASACAARAERVLDQLRKAITK